LYPVLKNGFISRQSRNSEIPKSRNPLNFPYLSGSLSDCLQPLQQTNLSKD